MQRIGRAVGEILIDRDHVLNGGDLGREDDLVGAHAELLGAGGGIEDAADQRLAGHRAGVERVRAPRILVHHRGEHFAVERAPIAADADRLVVLQRRLDDLGELLVLLLLEADIARIDAVFRQRLGAGRMIGQQFVADVMEVADERHVDAHPVELFADVGNGSGRFVAVDGDADELRAGAGKIGDLFDGAVDVGRVGIRHRLDDNRGTAADHDIADPNRHRSAATISHSHVHQSPHSRCSGP